MATSDLQANVLYGLGEGSNVANTTYLSYALRWINRAYREIYTKSGFKLKTLNKRSIFRTSNGQQTYQAPDDFVGFITIKDESNDTVITQVTPEEFARDVPTNSVTDEAFTSDEDVAVALNNKAILQYSETVTNTAGTVTYTRDTDYTISYSGGTITELSTGSMADATSYEIDYLYWNTGNPNQFCFEYDGTNKKYAFKFDPVPDDTYIASLVYPHQPTTLSGSIDPLWSLMDLALESGGIYYGSLEIVQDVQLRAEYKIAYKDTVSDLVKLDQDLIPKRNTIPIRMKRNQYNDRTR